MPVLMVQDEILKAFKELIYVLSKRETKNSTLFLPTFTESIKKFAMIINQHTEQQVVSMDDTPVPRMESPKITSSVDTTNKKHCKGQKQVHQKHIRANTPITTDPVETIINNFNANSRTKLLRVELVEWGNKTNNSLAPLVCTAKSTTPIISQETNNKSEPDKEQDKDESLILTPPTTRSKANERQIPTRTRYRTSRTPINISQNALYHVLGNAIATQPLCMIPQKFYQYEEHITTDNITEHSAYSGVVHPVTKEMITSYKKLMTDSITRIIWGKSIFSELGQLAQGYCDTP